jgi:Cys-rich protein (TIGR01571 family)
MKIAALGQSSVVLVWLSGLLSWHLSVDAALQRRTNSQLQLQLKKGESKSSAQEKTSQSSEDAEDSDDDDDDDDDDTKEKKSDGDSSNIGPARPHKKEGSSTVTAESSDDADTEKEVEKALQDSLRISESSAFVIPDVTKKNNRKASRAFPRTAPSSQFQYVDVPKKAVQEEVVPYDASLSEAEEAAKEVDATLTQTTKKVSTKQRHHMDTSRVVAFKAKFLRKKNFDSRAFRKKEEEIERDIDPHAREKARMLEKISLIEKELSTNLYRQKCLKKRMEHLSSKPGSDKEIDTTAEKVAEETQSSAMANMLGNMWKEIRMFEVPFYAVHVDEELRLLRQSEKVLEEKLTAAQARYSEAKRSWETEGSEKNEKDAGEKDTEEATIISSKDEASLESKEDTGGLTRDPRWTPAPTYAPGSTDEEWRSYKLVTAVEKIVDDYEEANSFWGLSWPEKERVLRNTLIYLLLGFAGAILYRYVQLNNPGVFDPAQRGYITNASDFSVSLFGCFGDLKTCLLGCLCPYSRYADTVDRRLSFSFWTYWKVFTVMFILVLLNPYTAGLSVFGLCIVGTLFRQALRKQFKIEYRTPKTVCLDLWTWLCCSPWRWRSWCFH